MKLVIVIVFLIFLPTIISLAKFIGLIGSQIVRFVLVYGTWPALFLLAGWLHMKH